MKKRINYYWRLFATGLSFTLFGIGGVILPLLVIPVMMILPGDTAHKRAISRKMVHYLFKGFTYIMRALGVLTWKTEGLEKLNRKGLLILANHPTLIDVVFIISFVPNASCIVKSKLLKNPAMRFFIRQSGYIENDKSGTLISDAKEALTTGANLVIFPEGTRTTEGEELNFHRGAANIAIRCGVDVTPVIVNCTPPSLSKQLKWHNIPDKKVVISFSVLDDYPVTAYLSGPAALKARQLTKDLETLFTKERLING